MDDKELVGSLHFLGIDESNCRVIALLPLARVAWADGGVQEAERTTILRIAKEGGFAAHADSERVLTSWLAHAPSEAYFERGTQVIVELARRGGGFDSGVTVAQVDAVLGYCETVARAAGGLFGLAFTVDKSEREAIAEIAAALRIDPTDSNWQQMSTELD